MFKFDFEAFLSRSGVLSDLPKIAVGFCPVGFCPVGFCPSGVLSQWGFVRLFCDIIAKPSDLPEFFVLITTSGH